MTESNFAKSSVRAAMNIVLTVSTTCLCSRVRAFCCSLAAEKFGEKIKASVTANAIPSCDDTEKPPAR